MEKLCNFRKTGSGKSTILSLISRLYDTTSGDILLDNKNIKELNLYNLRGSIGIVPQDAFLFSIL
jgi:ATP-binding cassette subfamily B protein